MREKSIGRSNLKIIAVFAAVILAGVFISQLTGCGEEYRTVCVVETKGVVEAVKDKIVYPAYSGMMLQEGYSIETIGDSFVRLVLDGDKYVKLEPGSKLVCEALGNVGSGKTKLSLEKGSMTAELVSPLKDDEEFTVNTPNAVLAVRGTFFRVDLNEVEDGDLVADVLTYGGQVAIRRILPTGKIVSEEVLIDAGYKVRVNMDTKNTVYVVDGIETVEPDKVKVPEPINVRDIPDEDMVDIYFSVQNGHELFISEEETATLIEEREIQIEEYTPVYEKAEIVAEKLEAGEISSIPVIQENEAKSRTSEDTGDPSEDSSDKSSTKDTDTKGSEKEDVKEDSKDKTKDTNTKGSEKEDAKEDSKDKTKDTDTKESEKEDAKEDSKDKTKDTAKGTGGKTSTTPPVVDNTQTTPVVVPTTGTTENGRGDTGNTSGDGSGGESSSSSGGSGSGSGGSSGGGSSHTHSYTSSVTTEPTCTGTGVRIYTCSCGDSYTETIDATGHNYTDSITKQPTCTGTGVRTYTCSCGDSYTETIDATGHNYTESITKQPTCTETGIRTYTCTCGDSYQESIPALAHTPTDSGANETSCSGCGKRMVKINFGPGANFPDSYFCTYVSDNFDNGDGYFTQEELDNVDIIDVSSIDNTLNLEGIKFFRNVKTLKAVGRNLSDTFDFTGLQNLETVDFSQSGIAAPVNLQGIATLRQVNIKECSKIKGLNLSNCPALSEINVENCASLEGIDVTGSNPFLNIDCTEADPIFTGLPDTVTGFQSTMKINGQAHLYHTPTDFGANETTCSGCGERMVKINSGPGANFPDSYFCTYVSDNFDNGDGYFTQEELDNVDIIDVSSIDNTLNLEGIKFFRNVKTLKAVGRDLSDTFDFTGLQNLETVDFSQSGIASSVNLQGIATLQKVNIEGCINMKGLNVSNCPALLEINAEYCANLHIKGIDVTESNPFLNIDCMEEDPIYKGLPDTVTGLQSTMTFNGLAHPYP